MHPDNVDGILAYAHATGSTNLMHAAREYKQVAGMLASNSMARRRVAMCYARALTSAEWRAAFDARSSGSGWRVSDAAAEREDSKEDYHGHNRRRRVGREESKTVTAAEVTESRAAAASAITLSGCRSDDAEQLLLRLPHNDSHCNESDADDVSLLNHGDIVLPRAVARVLLQVSRAEPRIARLTH
jgi:hypothetical protein